MRRWFAEFAEVIRRAHDSFAKMMLPESVDQHSRRERIGRTGNPFGQFQAPAAFGNRRLILAREHAREAARDQFAEPVVTAANVHLHIVNASVSAFRHAAFLQAVRDGHGP